MLIREMKIDDLDRIVELEHSLFSSPWHYEDFLYEINENQFSYNYVVEDEHHIVGYVGAWFMYEQAQITTIGVDLGYQRQGIGRMLLYDMIEKAKEKQCISMSLEVRVSNHKAIALYESSGFKKVAVRKNYYEDNHEDAYLMIKELGGVL